MPHGAHNNLGLWFDKSCLQFFNSTVAPSIMEFYPEVGVKRDVNSKPEVQNYALRGLLSVRYTLVAKDADSNWQGEGMDGWDLVGSTSAYQIYENKNWVPMGFAQQYYVTADQLDQVGEDSRAQVLLRAVLLDEDQIAAYGDLLQPIPDDGLTNCTQDTYAEDCTACRARPWKTLPPPAPALPPRRTTTPTGWCFSVCPTTTALPPPSTGNRPKSKRSIMA